MSPKFSPVDEALALILAEQASPERGCVYLGAEPSSIRAELDALKPPWQETLRVARTAAGELRGAVVVEWDLAVGRSWIFGPWVAGGAREWQEHASELLDAALGQLPDSVTKHELCGDVVNLRLGQLAAERGWVASEVNLALTIESSAAASWPIRELRAAVRSADVDDEAAIAELHDAEFPDTYATAAQLIAGALDGSRIVLVAPAAGAIVGYAAGEIRADGEGWIDFVAVRPGDRGTGYGRSLVMALAGDLLDASPLDKVSLTVQEHRTGARALYESLGFRLDASIVGYRSWRSGSADIDA
jgi:ribosomal protein S18 acetylase RimI-like enzyme